MEVRSSTIRHSIAFFVLGGFAFNVIVVLIAFNRKWLYGDEVSDALLAFLNTFAVPLSLIVATMLARQGSGPEEKRSPRKESGASAAFAILLCILWLLMVSFPWLAALLTGSDEYIRLGEAWRRFIDLLADVSIVAVVGYYFTRPASQGG